MKKYVVAIVGRKNVGKSTLLNRIAGTRVSIVEDLPGTTRDRITADAEWQGKKFLVMDTGGLETDATTSISRGINKQIETAIDEADIILFLTDARDGLHPDDIDLADRLRRVKKPVLLVANKADEERREQAASEFFRLGLGEPFPVSAYHGRGVGDLMDKVASLIPEANPQEAEEGTIKVAIVGKPNVGKSTLLNALAGEDRAIVDSTPGTTRDAVDTTIDFNGQSVILIDTAGIKRAGKIEAGIEQYSVVRSREAIDRSDIVLLVIDASEAVTAQDTHIGGYIQEAAKGIIIVANKWDLNRSAKEAEYKQYVLEQFRFVDFAPVILISAKTRFGTDNILPGVLEVFQERMKRLPTSKVNDVVIKAIAAHSLPAKAGRQLKIKYSTQAAVNPPTFVFSVNDPALVHFSYKRYLENKLREEFGFSGTSIRLVFKS
jgi:GTPase